MHALRRLGAPARVELAFELSEQARRISLEAMRSRDPRLSETEAWIRLMRRLLGDELAAAAYGSQRG
jgi:hypothetical protein